ncbi:MAG: hypothetical protein HYY65_07425, partial [Candidatus Tectomicrobia bacterium]|nr:hypothetical protein [Candidatus Tectomicrobia bacterium]
AIDPKTGSPLELGSGPFLLGAGLLGATLMTLLSALRGRALPCFGAIACSSLVVIVVSLTMIAPPIDGLRHGRLGDLAKMAGRRAGPDDTIVSYGLKKTSVVFYSRRLVREVDQGDLPLLKTLAQGKGSMWVLSRIEYEPDLRQVNGLVTLDKNPPYLLALRQGTTPSPDHGQSSSPARKR